MLKQNSTDFITRLSDKDIQRILGTVINKEITLFKQAQKEGYRDLEEDGSPYVLAFENLIREHGPEKLPEIRAQFSSSFARNLLENYLGLKAKVAQAQIEHPDMKIIFAALDMDELLKG